MAKKEVRLHLVLTESDATRLEELSKILKTSKSGVVRELVYHQHQILEVANR